MNPEFVFDVDNGAAQGRLNHPIQRIDLPVPLIDLEREQRPLLIDDHNANEARVGAGARGRLVLHYLPPVLPELNRPQNDLNADQIRERLNLFRQFPLGLPQQREPLRRRPLFPQLREQRAAVIALNDDGIELRDPLRFWCTYALCKKLIQNRTEEPDYQFGDWMRRTPEFMTAYQIITTASMRAEHRILGEINPWNFNEIRPVHQQNRIDFLLVQQLVTSSGINVKFRDWSGRNCLYIAVERRNVQLVEFLLEHGANTDTFDVNEETLVGNYRQFHQIFSDYGMLYNGNHVLRYDPLYLSIQQGDREITRMLIRAGAVIQNLQLKTAVAKNHMGVILFALEHGFDVNKLIDDDHHRQCSILHLASMMNKSDLMNHLLLVWNADFNIRDSNRRTPLDDAVRMRNEECVKILLDYHNNIPNQSSILHSAISRKSAIIVDLLIRHLAILEGQGPFVESDTYIQIEENANATDYFNICKLELERARETAVTQSLTFYDIITNTDYGALLRDESVVDMLTRYRYISTSFTVYGSLVRSRFEREQEKIEFYERVISGLSRIFGRNLAGHRLIYELILQNLSRRDWYTLSNL
ncbi:hypothetical protein QAD02_023947 [Eretmocerus hayati]|uniref:Uncharacterized protein n=1 Tax=Eretmocerus hayati TaxID=131215 RepID=A0ACC2Q0Q6_9HYME|nr:hypothetical protein QAD02_023947 [Eretmocerus hayati]